MSLKTLTDAALFPILALTIALSPVAALSQQPLPVVTTLEASPTNFTRTARLPGRIKASTVAEIRPQVSGIIRERLFEEGGRVEVGQPLYQIEDEVYKAAVAAAQATVAQAQASYDLAIVDARRAEELFSTQAGSAARRDKAVATRDAAKAALQMAQAQLTATEIDLDRTTIRSPINGVIGLSLVTTGSLVSAQQADALTTIRTLDPIYVDVTQSANDLLRWRTAGIEDAMSGINATMLLPNDEAFAHQGALTAAEPQVQPTTGMVTLRISFPNPDHLLLPGLYVEVEIPQSTEENAFLVPQSAVMRDTTGAAHAWIVKDGKIAERDLEILSASGNTWVVTEGLSAGDIIVTSGFQKAEPGAEVQIETDTAVSPDSPAEGR